MPVINKIKKPYLFLSTFLLLLIFLGVYLILPDQVNMLMANRYEGYTKIGNVQMPILVERKNYLETTEGELVLASYEYTYTGTRPTRPNLKVVIPQKLAISRHGDYGILSDTSNIWMYNYSTKEKSLLAFPTNLKVYDNVLRITSSKLSDSSALVVFEGPYNAERTGSLYEGYVLDFSTKQFTSLSSIDCPGIYCLPSAMPLNDQYAILKRGYGDGCGGGGSLALFNLKTYQETFITDYDNSCVSTDSAFVDIFNGKLLMNTTKFIAMSEYDGEDKLSSIYSLDPFTKEKQVLLTDDQIPADARSIRVVDNTTLILNKSYSDEYYVYDTAVGSLIETTFAKTPYQTSEMQAPYLTLDTDIELGEFVGAEKLTRGQAGHDGIKLKYSSNKEIEYISPDRWSEMYLTQNPVPEALKECGFYSFYFSNVQFEKNSISWVVKPLFNTSRLKVGCSAPQYDFLSVIADLNTGDVYYKVGHPKAKTVN